MKFFGRWLAFDIYHFLRIISLVSPHHGASAPHLRLAYVLYNTSISPTTVYTCSHSGLQPCLTSKSGTSNSGPGMRSESGPRIRCVQYPTYGGHRHSVRVCMAASSTIRSKETPTRCRNPKESPSSFCAHLSSRAGTLHPRLSAWRPLCDAELHMDGAVRSGQAWCLA
jgi:hypothetical protein